MTLFRRSVLAAFAIAFAPASASADETGPGISFELGGGVQVLPSYEGADSFAVGGFPIIKFNRLELRNGFTMGGPQTGLGFRPSFAVKGDRKAADHPELKGLNPIDTAVEIGIGLDYEIDAARFHGDIRRGVTGHEGVIAEAGVQLIARPVDGLTVSAGPRVSFADAEYMSTYFGVTAGEAAASGRSAYNAGGGVKSAGVEARLRYEFTNDWGVEGAVAWDRLVGDAADSPIVATGSADQFSGRIGLFRKFTVNF
jgi:outer membrane protein